MFIVPMKFNQLCTRIHRVSAGRSRSERWIHPSHFPRVCLQCTVLGNNGTFGFEDQETGRLWNDRPRLFRHSYLGAIFHDLAKHPSWLVGDGTHEADFGIMNGPFSHDCQSLCALVWIGLDSFRSQIDPLDDDSIFFSNDLLNNALLAAFGVTLNDLNGVTSHNVPSRFLGGFLELRGDDFSGFHEFFREAYFEGRHVE